MLARRPNRGARCQTPVIGEKFRAALLCLIALSCDCNETSPHDLVPPLLFGPVAGGNDRAQFTFSLMYMTFKETAMGKGLLLWLIGVPIPVILLLWLFFGS